MPAPAPTPTAPTRVRRWTARTRTVVVVSVSVFWALMAFGQHAEPIEPGVAATPMTVWATVGLFVMLGVCALLVWRHRWPVAVTAIAAGAALVLPTTPLPALIALAALLAHRRGPLVWALIGATYVASFVSVIHDLQATRSLVAIIALRTQSDGLAVLQQEPWVAALMAAVLLTPAVGVGLVRRAIDERDTARRQSIVSAVATERLTDEVARERDRREVAREVHDTLASRLSALSLHAGALELGSASDDPATARAARVVRETAQSSLEDLRRLIDMLRDPRRAESDGVLRSLDDIAPLLAADEGGPLRSHVAVSDAYGCDPAVAHAAFRVVQESLANARRHAPGGALRVDVTAGPATGVGIRVVNGPAAGPPQGGGGGHGLVGMRERVELVGGRIDAGPTPDGGFSVEAHLPWLGASAG